MKSVWKISKPVHMIDFGCGYGYLGLKLLPLLPEGSKYTGIDQGEKLIEQAKDYFKGSPYETEFFVGNIEEIEIKNQYDIAICHAFLLHMSDPKKTLKKMINAIVNDGKIICFEPHWISGMSSYELDGYDQSQIVPLGVLQKLFEKPTNINGNIGVKLPNYLSELDVKNIECRVSDKVNFLNREENQKMKLKLFSSLKEDGIGGAPIQKEQFIEKLIKRGVTPNDALAQFEAEQLFSQVFNIDASFVYAPSMKITFGDIKRVHDALE